jgi:hypothetical protein
MLSAARGLNERGKAHSAAPRTPGRPVLGIRDPNSCRTPCVHGSDSDSEPEVSAPASCWSRLWLICVLQGSPNKSSRTDKANAPCPHGGRFGADGKTPRRHPTFSPEENVQRGKDSRKKARSESGITKVELPGVVRDAWEKGGKPEGSLKGYVESLFWDAIGSEQQQQAPTPEPTVPAAEQEAATAVKKPKGSRINCKSLPSRCVDSVCDVPVGWC